MPVEQLNQINVKEIMEKIKEETSKMKKRELAFNADLEGFSTAPIFDSIIQAQETNSSDISLEDLLALDDENFVRNAYRYVLKREADDEGLRHYLKMIRKNDLLKAEVILRLRLSGEGRAQKVKIVGLWTEFFKKLPYRIPVFSYFFSLIVNFFKLPSIYKIATHGNKSTLAHIENLTQQQVDLTNKHDATAARIFESLDTFMRNLQTKADQAAIEQLIEKAGSKADRSEVMEIGEKLSAKADHAEMAEMREEIGEKLSAKADHAEVAEMRVEIGEKLSAKADHAEVAEMRVEIGEKLSAKADHAEVAEMIEKIATKADRIEVIEMQTKLGETIATKADQHELMAIGEKINENMANTQSTQLQNVNDITKLKDDTVSLFAAIRDHKMNIVEQQRRLSLLLEEARKRLPAPLDEEQLRSISQEEDHLLDAMYVTFEDRFRGTRADIKNRLKVYIPRIAALNLETKKYPILDLGCGRGEWLELLQENEFTAQGIDLNRSMIATCQEAGFKVEESDAIKYLRKQKSNAFSAITGFHIVEHLPLQSLMDLLNEAIRTLHPGGIVIFETPNPENLIVAACNFYYDPTHRNPLPPELLNFLVESRGFSKTEILRLHPYNFFKEKVVESGPLAELMALFEKEQDYAVIGVKA